MYGVAAPVRSQSQRSTVDIADLRDGFVNEPGLSDAWLPDDFD